MNYRSVLVGFFLGLLVAVLFYSELIGELNVKHKNEIEIVRNQHIDDQTQITKACIDRLTQCTAKIAEADEQVNVLAAQYRELNKQAANESREVDAYRQKVLDYLAGK